MEVDKQSDNEATSDSDSENDEKVVSANLESSSDDSEDDSDGNEAFTQETEELEKQVEANVYLYDQHVRLIQLLKMSGDLGKVRSAHERMRKIFPLTEELWLVWLRDEANIAVTDEEKEKLCQLFDDAMKDYLSIELWLEYAQFSIGFMGMNDGLEKCRGIFERAVMSGGLHVAKGSILWDAYREFEIALLSTMQLKEGQSSEDDDKVTQQTARVLNIFRRQLSVPLIDMHKTYAELMEFAEGCVDENIKIDYKKVISKLAALLPFENKLLEADPPRLHVYEEYMAYEMNQGEPTRIQCLFERALAENCLVPDLWMQYTQYLDNQLKIAAIVLPVYERALRNCPWSVSLWQGYLRALERYNSPLCKMKEVTEKALAAGFTTADEFRELWLTYLSYLRRQIDWSADHAEQLELLRATFERASKHLTDCFGEKGDPLCLIPQFWAKIEARYCHNMDKSREIWSDIMHFGHSKHAQMWMEYINLERMYGSPKALRKVFIRALQATADWTESIGEAWLIFERDEGTLEQWEYASNKFGARLKTLKEVAQKEDVQGRHSETQEKYKNVKQMKGKRKDLPGASNKGDLSNQKKRKFDQSNDASSRKSFSEVDSEGFKVPLNKGKKSQSVRVSSPDGPSPSKMAKMKTIPDGNASTKKIVHDSSKDERTIFISNLLFDLAEDKIRETFSKVGEITDLRLVKDFRGRSRGYGYIEFACWDIALKALQMDREPIDGRPMFVSKCEDRKKSTGPKFKYNTGMEKNKLFVKGLPFSVTKEKLVELFEPFGALKEARLVTFRNGNSKGLAFVEYNDEVAAASAQAKMDGFKIESHTLSVAISNPPERGSRSGTSDSTTRPQGLEASLGAGSKEVGVRGRGRTQVSLLPRSIMRSKPPLAEQSATPKVKSENDGCQSNGGVIEGSKVLSNNDFRKMLLD